MQPPPQHPYIRARNVLRSSDTVSSSSDYVPPLPPQRSVQPNHVEHASATGQTTSIERDSTDMGISGQHIHGTPPTRHPYAAHIHRSTSEPAGSSIASLVRGSMSTATLAIPEIVEHDASHSSTTRTPSRAPSPVPSPEPLSRTSTSTSYFEAKHSQRPTVSLFNPHSQHRKDVASALEELRALELDEFLERTSKNTTEVRFDEPVSTGSTHLPALQKFKNPKTGQTDYLKFAETWLCAYADLNLPRDLVSDTRPSKFSFSHTRLAMERLYVLVPPSLLEKLLSGDLVRLYRWHDPIKTSKSALTYLACWWYDQIPAAVFAFLAYQVVKPRIWPPTPAEIRRKLAERKARSKEAKDLDEDLSKRQPVSHMSHSIAASVGIASVMGGINMIHPSTERHGSSSDEDGEVMKEIKKDKKQHRGKYGMYKLVMELIERFGPAVEMLMIDQADFAEKAKNLVLWRRPSASKQSLVIIGACTLVLSVMSGRVQLKLLLFWVWFQFFIVWPLQDRYPRYRRAMNPFWYLLWNVPNDAESALEILKQRAAHAHTTEVASRESLSVEPARRGRTRSVGSISQASLHSEDSDGHPVLWKHFALYKGLPGSLMLTSTEMYFNSSKGFRTLSSKLFKGSSGATTPTGEASKTTTVFRELLANITLVKKESRFEIGFFDTDGLQVTFADGKSVRLAAVAKRDEAFAFILAHSTSQRAAIK